MKIFQWLVGFIGLSCTSLVFSAQSLDVFENQYSAKMYGFSITATSRLSALQDDNYELYFNAKAVLGNVTETSQFKWDAKEQTIIPQQYSYKRDGLGKNREDALSFDWTGRQVNNTARNTSIAIAAAQKLQDGISYQLQLRQDLLAGKNNLVYPIADGKRIKEYRFEIVGEEILTTPLGDVKTVKIKRSHKTDERNTYVWFAKDFQYLLVRLQQEENGSAYTIYISKASLNGKAIEHF